MTPAIDLDAYFDRIGYAGKRAPTLDVLRAIHLRHPQAIAFENLDPLLGRPVRLDAQSLEQKLVRGGRGGYCFEHNLLLSHVLRALGFRVTGLAARVRWSVPAGTETARTHMLLSIDLPGGPYIADVGFGAMTLTGPLRLAIGCEQATPHEPFRLIEMGGEYEMQAGIRGGWSALYRFSLHAQLQPDYEVANWYVSTHPESRFVNALMASRVTPDGRYALRNNELTVHHLNGGSERNALASAAELRAALADVFLLKLPDAPALDAALSRLTSRRVE